MWSRSLPCCSTSPLPPGLPTGLHITHTRLFCSHAHTRRPSACSSVMSLPAERKRRRLVCPGPSTARRCAAQCFVRGRSGPVGYGLSRTPTASVRPLPPGSPFTDTFWCVIGRMCECARARACVFVLLTLDPLCRVYRRPGGCLSSARNGTILRSSLSYSTRGP